MNALHWDCVVSRHKSWLYQQPAARLYHSKTHFYSPPYLLCWLGSSLEKEQQEFLRLCLCKSSLPLGLFRLFLELGWSPGVDYFQGYNKDKSIIKSV